MNNKQAEGIVISIIKDALERREEITEEMQLIGGDSLLDSMKLVEVCLALEDFADEHGFEFDWTSKAAISKSRSIFRNVAALAEGNNCTNALKEVEHPCTVPGLMTGMSTGSLAKYGKIR